MKEPTKLLLFIGFTILTVSLSTFFYTLAGVSFSSSSLSPNSLEFVRLGWTTALISLVCFVFLAYYGFRFLLKEFFENEIGCLFFSCVLVTLAYGIPIGFIKAWYDDGLGWVSLILMLVGIFPFLAFFLIMLIILISDDDFLLKKLLLFFIGLLLFVGWGFPWGVVIYHREVFFQSFPSIEQALNSNWIFACIGIIVISEVAGIIGEFFDNTKKKTSIINELSSEEIEEKTEIGEKMSNSYLDDNESQHDTYDLSYVEFKMLLGLIFIIFSAGGIIYLMTQTGAFPAKNDTSLNITTTVWLIWCLGFPSYYLFFAYINHKNARRLKRKLFEDDEKENKAFMKFINDLEKKEEEMKFFAKNKKSRNKLNSD